MLLDHFTVIIYSICIGQIVPFCVTGIASNSDLPNIQLEISRAKIRSNISNLNIVIS